MTGGTLTIDGTSRGGNGALDVNGDFLVSGGILAATDAGGMKVSPSASSSQSFVASTFDTQQAGAEITVVDSAGTVVARSTPTKSYTALVVSSSKIVAGDSYALVGGGGRGQGGPGGSGS
jgi:hypothetical protein